MISVKGQAFSRFFVNRTVLALHLHCLGLIFHRLLEITTLRVGCRKCLNMILLSPFRQLARSRARPNRLVAVPQ